MSQQGSASGGGRSSRGGGRGGRGGGFDSRGGGRGSIGGGHGCGDLDSGARDQSVSGDRNVSGGGGRGVGDRSGASVDLHSLSRVRGSPPWTVSDVWEDHNPAAKGSVKRWGN